MSADDNARIDAIEQALLARWPETRISPTLDRIAALTDILGSPHLTYPTIHVGGTNGKTTTSRMIDSLLFEIGLSNFESIKSKYGATSLYANIAALGSIGAPLIEIRSR